MVDPGPITPGQVQFLQKTWHSNWIFDSMLSRLGWFIRKGWDFNWKELWL